MADLVRHPFDYTIAIPASFVSDIPHMREKTFRIGLIGRATAMFRVNDIAIYPDMPDKDQRAETKLVQFILSYMETPQYLRRRLFRIVPELQYAGTLPPLRTLHHPVANRISDLRLGELREGAVVSASKEGTLIDIGVEQPALLPEIKLKADSRVTARISALGRTLKVALADLKDIKTYWGYKVSTSEVPFCQFVEKGRFNLVIATSRKGKQIKEVRAELASRWETSHRTLMAFGAPTQGLHEIAAREHRNLEDVADFVVNMIPGQATETVRTEEAVYASLSILNTLVNGA
jgi:predicted SPOUT superfamily RNA methylase MTH1